MVNLKGSEKRSYVADMFSRISQRYDVMNTLMTFGMDRRWRKTTAQVAAETFDGAALDIATGTGALALELGHVDTFTKVVGIDLVESMITQAAKKADDSTKTSFVMGDALSLPFPDESFSCVTSAFALRNMPDLELALEEMIRVVKQGGKIVTLETMPMAEGILRPIIQRYFRNVVPVLGAAIAGDRAAYSYLPESVDKFLLPEGLDRLFKAKALKNVSHKSLGFGSVYIHSGIKDR